MRPYLFKIGNFELRIYSLMYIIAFIFAIFLASRDEIAKKRGVKNRSTIEDLAFWAMVSGLIGARIYYVLFNLSDYMKDPISILEVWQGGLAIHGGIIGGFIGVLLFSKKKKLNLWVLTDMSVSPLIFGQFLGRFGNLANGEIHGFPTFTPISVILKGNFNEWWQEYQSMSLIDQSKYHDIVPWGIVFPTDTPAGIEFPNYALHPAMLYESFLNLIGFFLLWKVFRKKEYPAGVLTMIYLLIYGIIRIIVSTFRAEDLLYFGIRVPYLISIVMIVISLIGIKYFMKNKQ